MISSPRYRVTAATTAQACDPQGDDLVDRAQCAEDRRWCAAIFSPAIAGVAVTVLFGWLQIFSGILHLAYAWQAGRPGAVVWEILLGVLYGGIGFYLLARPGAGLASLTLARSSLAVGDGGYGRTPPPSIVLDSWASIAQGVKGCPCDTLDGPNAAVHSGGDLPPTIQPARGRGVGAILARGPPVRRNLGAE